MQIYLRKMNRIVHPIIFPFYFVLGLLIICSFAFLFIENSINISKYGAFDFLLILISTFGSLMTLIFMSLAYIYADASRLAPLTNIQNVFNFLIEFIVLRYNFGLTDVLGVLVFLISFLVPVVFKLKFSER